MISLDEDQNELTLYLLYGHGPVTLGLTSIKLKQLKQTILLFFFFGAGGKAVQQTRMIMVLITSIVLLELGLNNLGSALGNIAVEQLPMSGTSS